MSVLDDTLDLIIRDLQDFIQLLEEEARYLAGADAERLEPVVARREAISAQLARHWQELAGQLRLPANASLATLRQHAEPGLPSPAWLRLETLAREAEHLNRVNGRLLEEQMRRTHAAMQVLQNAAASRSLYGADGRVTGFPNLNRSIDKA